MASKKEVAKTQDQLPAELLEEMAADAGVGFEEAQKESYAVPFIGILQKMSPQVEEDNPQYIEGARAGMLLNTVTEQLYDGRTGIVVAPAHYTLSYVEWVDREEGGGFVAEHDAVKGQELLTTCQRDPEKGNIDVLPSGNHLVPTANHYVVLLNEGGELERVVIAMARTAMKKSRRWMTIMQNVKLPDPKTGLVEVDAPMFAKMYRLRTALETNRNNQSWHNWDTPEPVAWTKVEAPHAYTAARAFQSLVRAGKVALTPRDTMAPEAETETESDDIPF